MDNDSFSIVAHLREFPDVSAVAIESTYNYYWLADVLLEAGYDVELVHTSAVSSYGGIKYTDDVHDALTLCELWSIGRLPTGFVCPKDIRSVRDLLRRRGLFVKVRRSLMLSVQGLFARMTGKKYSFSKIDKIDYEGKLEKILDDPMSARTAEVEIEAVNMLQQQIKRIEKSVEHNLDDSIRDTVEILMRIPGIGIILGMTIALETGPIGRFRRCANYVSYCCNAPSERISNNKKKGSNNRKNGNKHLGWAWYEAGAHAILYSDPIRKYYNRKLRRSKSSVLAMRATGAKLCKAAYYMMKNNSDFLVEKAFG